MNIYDHYVISNKREMANVLKYLEYIDSERINNNINRYNLSLIFLIKDYLIQMCIRDRVGSRGRVIVYSSCMWTRVVQSIIVWVEML